MPPKGWRKYPDGFKPTNAAGTPVKDKDQFSLDDLLFPRSTVLKLAKETFATGSGTAAAAATQVPKDAQTALARSASMFVSYLALEANTIARDAGRKTVLPSDVFRALDNVQFGAFSPKVREDLAIFESHAAARKEQQRERRERGISKVFEYEIEDDDEELLIEDDDAADAVGEDSKDAADGRKNRKAGGESDTKKRKEAVVKVPKQRGRKKKTVLQAEAATATVAETVTAETAKEPKRPRGRPGRPKVTAPIEDEETEPEENADDDEMDVDEVHSEEEEEEEEEGGDKEENEDDEEEESGHKVVSGMHEARELEQGGLDDDSTAEEIRPREEGSEDEEDEEDEKLNARR